MTKKIAISLPDDLLARVRSAVGCGRAPNVSNYLAALIEREAAAESFREMVADWFAEAGASEAQIRAARRRALADFERAGLLGKKPPRATRKAG